MAAQIGYFDSLKNVTGKVFNYLASITLTGTDGKTLTVEDNSLVNQDLTTDANPSFASVNNMLIKTATGIVPNATVFTEIASFQLSNRAVFKLIIGSDVGGNTVGVNEYIGSTGGIAGYVENTTTYRSHAWEAYYEVLVGTDDIVHVNATRGSDAARLSVYKILLISY